MNKMRRTIVSIVFVAVLAFSFVTSATTAYAGGGNSQGQNGQPVSPRIGGGAFHALGISWE